MFTGSFDPFTIGHDSIVRRIVPLFDRIVIGVGINGRKHCMASPEDRVMTIQRIYAGNGNIEVVAFSDCAIDLAKRTGAQCIVRGVRNVRDFEYERDQAEINRMIGGIETLLLFAEPQLACLSSSAVRELTAFGKNVDELLPPCPPAGGVPIQNKH